MPMIKKNRFFNQNTENIVKIIKSYHIQRPQNFVIEKFYPISMLSKSYAKKRDFNCFTSIISVGCV